MISRAERNIRWIEDFCRVPEGKDIGKPVRLRPWQKDDLRKIYDNPHGTRLAIISFGKKNGKTSLAGCLLLLHTCGPEAIPNTQLPSTAQSKEQAAVLFGLAAKMVRFSPSLDAAIVIRDTVKQLHAPTLGTLYKALSAEASTAHGQSPIFAVHDELGQVRGPVSELYNAVENAMGAHEAPMSVIISTQAPNDSDLLSILIDDALAGHDPHTVISLYSADMSIDPFSDEALLQANPAFGDFLNADEVRKQAENARRLSSQEPLFRNYTLNQRVEASSPFVSRGAWQECGGPVAADFKGRPVYGGLDLSEVNDLTALVLVAPFDDVWNVKPTFWLPGASLREKARHDRVPYDVWAKEGFLTPTPGPTVDYEYVAKALAAIFDHLDVRKIAFDRWNWRHLKPYLAKVGFTEAQLEGDNAVFEQMGQGFQSMSPALRELESAILNGKIAHGNHPVLGMCAANATVQTDPAGNRKLSKSKSHGRIDGMVALAMAMSVAGTHKEAPKPTYQMLFVG
ncbi:terminase TerL endonuclease subunit [Mesorhizobium sp. NZP2077]|uniref:terminase large subunit n=1 Tax=Mesorhizobium sp. NZP2077 TaxID=2483404 RepID=UPI001555B0F2|nr:terminase TerL endonuclease subunit [Mesorhizobium sp. NZP2077]QKC83951.1 terminase large subunit [Mesorhizobium sp. NZP2077]QKD17488.1 terminase large subunit [Mesorhizobium sp. NZP2077]